VHVAAGRGEQDGDVAQVICGPRWAHEMHTTIPRSELVEFEHSGHMAHLEEPEEFARVVADFAARHGS
jgi:pimeloyl-ACP methyl ester carboxylesterase